MKISYLYFLTPIALFLIGCSASDPEPDLSKILKNQIQPARSYVFDFGTVLARGQELNHEFLWNNSDDREIKVVNSKINVPCCSRMGDLPNFLPPGGSAVVPTFLKAGHVADQKRVTFDIETDVTPKPVVTFALLARFVPEWEVQESGGQTSPLLIGETATRSYRLIGRRQAGEGRPAPSEVIVPEGLLIDSITPAKETQGTDGIIESIREMTVTLPTRSKLGPNSAEMSVRWPDGMAQNYRIYWNVGPRIRTLPSVLLLKAQSSPTSIKVEVRSENRPFRIIRVSGEILTGEVQISPEPAQAHTLRFTLETAKLTHGMKSDIEIKTDDPDQPLLTVGVLVTPNQEVAP